MSSEDEKGPLFEGKKSDESWKEKAREEKEKLAEREKAQMARDLPPASFLLLLEDLYIRSMAMLGQIHDPKATEVYIDLQGAKYCIDTIEMLEQKTKGNLEPQEESALREILHGLRLIYVDVARAVAEAPATPGAGKKGPESDGPPPEKPGPKIIL